MATTIVIRPSEYWPGLASVALMQQADIVVLADTFQYSRQSFQNRMRIRNPDGWQWVTVPLKGSQHGRPQSRTRIRQVPGWRKRHWKALLFNYSQSAYFNHYMDSIEELYHREWTYLGDLNLATNRLIQKWMGGSFVMTTATEVKGSPNCMSDILNCYPKAQLLAPAEIPEPYSTHRLHFSHPTYHQAFVGFVSGMTVLDLLLNYGPESAGLLRKNSHILPT